MRKPAILSPSTWAYGAAVAMMASATAFAAAPQPTAQPSGRNASDASGHRRLIPPDPSARKVAAAMNLLDRQGKGYVTADDFAQGRAFAPRLFAALDRDGNGTVSRREFIAGGDGGRSAEFARLDRGRKGYITQAEFVKGWNAELFAALSHGRGAMTAGDLRPGFETAAAPTAPRPAQPAPQAGPAVPTGVREMGNQCWIPLKHGSDHAVMIFPWSLSCR